MSKRKPYQKRPESNTRLKSHVLPKADWYEVDLIVEVRRTIRLKARSEDEASFFAENRIRQQSKGFGYRMDATIGDIHLIEARKEKQNG